jgi:hypothetical protein
MLHVERKREIEREKTGGFPTFVPESIFLGGK